MKAYKGFDKNMKCRNFQYEEGKTYEHPGTPNLCQEGFHACEGPLDVLSYYTPSEGCFFHEVELDGVTDQREDDTKVCGKKITLGARLTLAQLIKAGIDFRFSKTTTKEDGINKERYGAASATGYYGAASATGYYGAASATGYKGAASATGYYGAASATGYYGAASATGNKGAASATGYNGAASATGENGAASATGENGAASATGYKGAASATGKAGVAVAAGDECKAMGALGCALFLVERKWDDEKEISVIVNVAAVIVDGENIKPDTWYSLKDGKITEV